MITISWVLTVAAVAVMLLLMVIQIIRYVQERRTQRKKSPQRKLSTELQLSASKKNKPAKLERTRLARMASTPKSTLATALDDDQDIEMLGAVEVIPVSMPAAKPQPSLIVLYVMALPGEAFSGYELLQAILMVGLRFGEMQIFHFYKKTADTNQILFSLASATEPGSFDLNAMGNYQTQGLCLFMDAKGVAEPGMVFELMIDTAKQLAAELQGQLHTETHQALTPAWVEHYRKLLSTYE